MLNINELRKTWHYTPWKNLREGMERDITFVDTGKKKPFCGFKFKDVSRDYTSLMREFTIYTKLFPPQDML